MAQQRRPRGAPPRLVQRLVLLIVLLIAVLFIVLYAVRGRPGALETASSVRWLSEECHLTGVWQAATGRCVCVVPGWRGPRCGQLALKPAASASAARLYPPAGDDERGSWDASMARGDDGRWHLYASTFPPRQLGLTPWSNESAIEHAVSEGDDPRGPFTRVGIALPAEAHNPAVVRGPDGSWLLYHIGKAHGSSAPSPAFPSGIGDIGLAASTGPDGPWRLKFPLVPHGAYHGVGARWDNWLQHPSPYVHRNGSVSLVLSAIVHANPLHTTPEWRSGFSRRGVAMAHAKRWGGEYRLRRSPTHLWPVREGEGEEAKATWAEDPFLFRQRGMWHLLLHRWHKCCAADDPECPCSGHAFARDLDGPWTLSDEAPFPGHVPLASAEPGAPASIRARRRERPQIVFGRAAGGGGASEGGEPVPRLLITAVEPEDSRRSYTWTAAQEFE